MRHTICTWCLKKIQTSSEDDANYYCCRSCYNAELMFRQWQSDENINRQRHYDELTRGEDYDA